MKSGPTLVDDIVRMSHQEPRIFKPPLREALTRARRFVLDESMSAFMADIGWAAYREALKIEDVDKSREKIRRVVESVRQMARLPFPATWIEWDEQALARRAREVYASSLNPVLVPQRSGWLLQRHPLIETAITATSFGFGSMQFGSEGKPDIGVTPFAVTWCTDDNPLPWRHHPLAVDGDGMPLKFRGADIAGVMTGLIGYESKQIGISTNDDLIYNRPDTPAVEFRKLFYEQAGMLRYLFGLLATINDLPVVYEEVVAAKGYVAKGNYRRFLSHQVVTLKVPASRYRAIANRVVIGLRRKGHEVRSHWRRHRSFPPTVSCQHFWEPLGQSQLKCTECSGRLISIKEHVRGDTSLGFVTHDYRVEHEEG